MATINQPNFNEDNEEKSNKSGSVLNQTSGLTGANQTGGMTATATNTPAPPKPKGSGRFTNLQKYLDANKLGGQQIASGIGQNIQGDLSQQKQQSQDYYSNIGQSIQQAKNVAQQGGQFLQNLQGIGQNIQQATGAENFNNRPQNFGIDQFVQSPDFNQFQNIQAGRGIDERLLQSQQADLSGAAQNYLGSSTDALNQLSTEGGRFGLLKDTFGGNINPQYSTGQQRLDQLFLARQGLQPLQQDVRQDVKAARDLVRQAGQTGATIGNIAGQEQQLMQDINQQSLANQQAYLDMLDSYVPEINQQRQAEWQGLEDALASYRQPSGDSVGTQVVRPGLSTDQLQRLGVDREYGAFDVLENLTGASDVATRGRDAQGFQDVATDMDVNKYTALAQIAGVDPTRLTQAADLGDAYTAREGDANLANRLQSAQQIFDNLASETGFHKSHRGSRGKDMFGGVEKYRGGAYANAADLLKRGEDAITKYRSGAIGRGRGRAEADKAYRQVLEQFQQFLQDQNYGRTIGGQVVKDPNQGIAGYGTRTTPGEQVNTLPFGTPIKLAK